MVNDKVIELEKELWNKLNEYFPKGGSQNAVNLRSKAMVIFLLAKELGIQGHADYITKCVKLGADN